MIAGTLMAVFWFLLFLIGQIIYFSFYQSSKRSQVILFMLSIALSGHLATVFIVYRFLSVSGTLFGGGMLMAVFNGWLTIFCLFVLYMPFYYVIVTSLSVETMILIDASEMWECSIEQLQDVFVSRSLISGRLETMRRNGWLSIVNGRYRLTKKGLSFAKVFNFMKKLWRLGPGG